MENWRFNNRLVNCIGFGPTKQKPIIFTSSSPPPSFSTITTNNRRRKCASQFSGYFYFLPCPRLNSIYKSCQPHVLSSLSGVAALEWGNGEGAILLAYPGSAGAFDGLSQVNSSSIASHPVYLLLIRVVIIVAEFN